MHWPWSTHKLFCELSCFTLSQTVSSVARSCPTLQPHGQYHARLPYPSPISGACSNSSPFSRWYHPTISSSVVPYLLLPSIFPSIRVFSSESVVCIRWPKDWSFSFNISPSNEYSGLISFRMGWLDLFAVQGTLKSFLQHSSSKTSILQRLAFFIVQLSHPYMTTGKTIPLPGQNFVGNQSVQFSHSVMSDSLRPHGHSYHFIPCFTDLEVS